MSKRLQVLLDETEYREIQRASRLRKMTVAEWVRQALRAARRREPSGEVKKRLEIVRAAARHSYPTGDIDQMTADTERGYGTGSEP
ncbi:MAG: antitoxin [Acidobacteriota bacterium]